MWDRGASGMIFGYYYYLSHFSILGSFELRVFSVSVLGNNWWAWVMGASRMIFEYYFYFEQFFDVGVVSIWVFSWFWDHSIDFEPVWPLWVLFIVI